MNVDARMAACQTRDLDAPRLAGWGGATLDLAPGHRVDAAGAADAKRVLLFVVEIEEVLGLEQSAGKLGSAGEAALFVDRKDEFERAMGDRIAFHDGERGSHAHSVVGAESRAVGFEPVAIHHQADGVGIEVVERALVLLADHVQVALNGSRNGAGAPRARGLADDHIAGGVLHRFQAQTAGQGKHIFAGSGFLFRGAGNGRKSGKVLPDGLGFEIVQG